MRAHILVAGICLALISCGEEDPIKAYACSGSYIAKSLNNNLTFSNVRKQWEDVLVLDTKLKTAKMGGEISDGVIEEINDNTMIIKDKSDDSIHKLDRITGDLEMPNHSVVFGWDVNCKPKEKL